MPLAGNAGMASVVRFMVAIVLLCMPAEAFIRHLCFNPLGFARIDPLVSPGQPGQHVHHLHGASNLGLTSLDPDFLLESNCTSCSITSDKSVYWAPAMYFEHENGTFSLLTTASAITIYYKLEKRVNFLDRNYTVFPKGFRMLAGSTTKRAWEGSWPVPEQSYWGPNDTTQAALAEKAIGFNCLNYHSAGAEASLAFPYLRDKAFTDAHCADGVRAEILFPSCWDGVNFDSADHKSHLAYPTLIQDGACPETHPVYLPVLFFETIWNTQEYAGIPGRYVLANGDPTGYGYHADFIAAWEDGVLQRITDDPTCTDHDLEHRHTDGIQEKCLAIKDRIQSPAEAAQCTLVVPEILKHEQVSGLLDALPLNVAITGTRHDPGAQNLVAPVSNVQPTTSTDTTPLSPIEVQSSSSPVMPEITPGPEKSDVLLTLTTSIYTESNILYKVIFVQTVVTETVTAATPAPAVARRHRHGHGHGNHHD